MPGILPSIPAPPSDQPSLLSWAAVVTTYLRNLRNDRGKLKDEFLASAESKARASGYAPLKSDRKIPFEHIPIPPLLHVQDEKAANTDGGTFTLGAWRDRDLTTTVSNGITGATLSDPLITLPAGTYRVHAWAVAFDVDYHKIRLYNNTAAAELVSPGMVFFARSGGGGDINAAVLNGIFVLGVESAVKLQHRCTVTQATNGFGSKMNVGVEIYADVLIEQLVAA